MSLRSKALTAVVMAVFYSCFSFGQSLHFGTSANEWATDIAASDNGFAILGNIEDLQAGGFNLWLILTDTSGNVLNQKSINHWERDFAAGIVKAPDGFYLLGTSGNAGGDEADLLLIKTDLAGNTVWEKSFGGGGRDIAGSLCLTASGLWLTGTTTSADFAVDGHFGASDIFVIKTDFNGNEIFRKTFGGSRTDKAEDIRMTSDGGVIVTGTTSSQDGNVTNMNGQSDLFVCRLDATGQLLWTKTFGGPGFDYGMAGTAVQGGFAFVGIQSKLNTLIPDISKRYDQDLLVIKTDASGNVLWQKTIDKGHFDAGLDIFESPAGGELFITGYAEKAPDQPINDPYSNFKQAYTVKLDAAGTVLWELMPTAHPNMSGAAMAASIDGSPLAFTGTTDATVGPVTTSGQKDIWFDKLTLPSAPFNVSLGTDFGVCKGTPVTLDATVAGCNGCTYHWEDNSSQPVRTFTPAATQTYSVTVTNPSGQSSADAITVSVFPSPGVNLMITGANQGQSNGVVIVIPQSGTPNYQIQWAHGPVTFSLFNLAAGTYEFTVTDAHGCRIDSSATVPSIVATSGAELEKAVVLFPNPAHEQASINAPTPVLSATLLDGEGHPVKNYIRRSSLRFDGLPAGEFFLRIRFAGGKIITRRLIVY